MKEHSCFAKHSTKDLKMFMFSKINNVMKKSNLFLAALAVAACTNAHSQTKMIAHRSHSGSTATFSTKGEGNFGNPPMRIDSLIKISDTKMILVSDPFYRQRDTIDIKSYPYTANPNIPLDSLKKLYPETTFVGFDKPKKPIKKTQQK